MNLIVMVFNFLVLPFVALYIYLKKYNHPAKFSFGNLITYGLFVGGIGVAAKATAVCIANSFELVIFHYQPEYAVIVLVYVVLVPYAFEMFMRNVNEFFNKKKNVGEEV